MGEIDRRKARLRRHRRVRKRVTGTKDRPRLNVFRSLAHTYAQVIDDGHGFTLATASSLEKVFKEQTEFENKVAAANFVGKLLGERAIKKGIKQVVFDRNGFLYHGRVKSLSEGARETGLVF